MNEDIELSEEFKESLRISGNLIISNKILNEYYQLKRENNQLKEELERLKQPTIFIDTQDMEERYGEELYKEYLENENNQLAEKVINQRHALCDTNKKIQVLNARIEKAIEYIDDIVPCIHDEELLDDLSKILKGGSND